jgi:alanine dehydrogenase
LPAGSTLNYMAGSDGAYFGIKVYSTHPASGAHFLFLLYAAADANPLAIFEANSLGRIRTGAVSGYATRLLSRKDASTVGLIGSGFQARTQIEAMCAVRPVRRVKVWSRSEDKRRGFAQECSTAFGIDVSAAATSEEAVRGADIVITATNARQPVLESSWIAPGTHVNAMGSNQANKRELPGELILRADLIAVDSLEQARMESGDLLMALEPEQWRDRNVRELREVSGRPSADAITIFKSNGIAAEDVVSAGYIYEKALRNGKGRGIPVLAG